MEERPRWKRMENSSQQKNPRGNVSTECQWPVPELLPCQDPTSQPWSAVRDSRPRGPNAPVLNIASRPNPLLTAPQREELSKHIVSDSAVLESSGFEALVNERRGKSDFGNNVKNIKHESARCLHHIKKRGANVVLQTPPWSIKRLEETIKRGPHKSSEEHAEFLREELLDFVQKGFWTMLPWRLVKKHKRMLRILRMSPVGVAPQRARRP
jgi:hypothetical protein